MSKTITVSAPIRPTRDKPLAFHLQVTLEEFHHCGPGTPGIPGSAYCQSEEHPDSLYGPDGCEFIAEVVQTLVAALPSHRVDSEPVT